MKKIIVLLFLFLCSCALQPPSVFEGSYVGYLPPNEVQNKIIKDCVNFLVEKYPPGYTALNAVYPQRGIDSFSLNLESALREKGFEISPSANLRLGWFFNTLDPEPVSEKEQWYVKLWLSSKDEKQIVTRIYTQTGDPVAGFANGKL